jgi:hypothetical protein
MKQKYFDFLNKVYEAFFEKLEEFGFNMWQLGEQLNYSRDETRIIVQYLKDEDLIKYVGSGGTISITHEGIKERERAIPNIKFQDERKIYFTKVRELAGEDTNKILNMFAIGEQLGFDKTQTYIIVEYLKQERLLDYPLSGGAINITHFAVKQQ